jgi:hypothetical protein
LALKFPPQIRRQNDVGGTPQRGLRLHALNSSPILTRLEQVVNQILQQIGKGDEARR